MNHQVPHWNANALFCHLTTMENSFEGTWAEHTWVIFVEAQQAEQRAITFWAQPSCTHLREHFKHASCCLMQVISWQKLLNLAGGEGKWMDHYKPREKLDIYIEKEKGRPLEIIVLSFVKQVQQHQKTSVSSTHDTH